MHQDLFSGSFLPDAANLATAPTGVDLEACPPVLEYTSVSNNQNIYIFTGSQYMI